jgi:hypothetical protein
MNLTEALEAILKRGSRDRTEWREELAQSLLNFCGQPYEVADLIDSACAHISDERVKKAAGKLIDVLWEMDEGRPEYPGQPDEDEIFERSRDV